MSSWTREVARRAHEAVAVGEQVEDPGCGGSGLQRFDALLLLALPALLAHLPPLFPRGTAAPVPGVVPVARLPSGRHGRRPGAASRSGHPAGRRAGGPSPPGRRSSRGGRSSVASTGRSHHRGPRRSRAPSEGLLARSERRRALGSIVATALSPGRGGVRFPVVRSFAVRRGLDDRVDEACLAQALGSFDPHRLRDLLQLGEELSLQRAAVHGFHRCPASLSRASR